MHISDLFSLGIEYLVLGLVLAAVLGAGAVFYRFIYRRKFSGGNSIGKDGGKMSWQKMVLYGLVICYLVVVFGATTLSRGAYYEGYGGSLRLQLFYSYREAWRDFSITEWRNIILNILMFVPWGFLLPLLHRKFRKAGWTYLAGLALTAVIEGIQLVLKRGIFEVDDLFNNLLGAMIGYGIWWLWDECRNVPGDRCVVRKNIFRRESVSERNIASVREAVSERKIAFGKESASGKDSVFGKESASGKEKVCGSGRTITLTLYQLPLIAAIAAFIIIFTVYDNQELGNLPSEYIVRQKVVNVTTELKFSEEEAVMPVYQLQIADREETAQQAESFFALFGAKVDEAQTDVYENTIVYWSDASQNLWIDYKGSPYKYTDFELLFGEDVPMIDISASEEEVRLALEKLQIVLPEGTVCEIEGKEYCFTADMIMQDGTFYDGILRCSYTEDDSFAAIDNMILESKPYKDFAIISETEAFRRLQAGEFYYPYDAEWNIEIYDAYLVYEADSKGFYQPVYRFDAMINENDGYIIIPALAF